MTNIQKTAKFVAAIAVIFVIVAAVGFIARANGSIAYASDVSDGTETADVTPYIGGKNYVEAAIGGKLGKVKLAEGWSITAEHSDDVVTGSDGDFKTIESCVSYNGGEPCVLKIKTVTARVDFVDSKNPSGAIGASSKVAYVCEEDGTVKSQKIEQLLNPYSRAGYELSGWQLSDGTVIPYGDGEGEYETGEPYEITDNDLLDVVMTVYVLWVPKTDTKVTVNIYNQNTDGSYGSAPTLSKITTGTSDGTISEEELGLEIKEGFLRDYISSEQAVDGGFLVKADGSSVINVYLKRKSCVVKFVAGEYEGAKPGGTLPDDISTFYGAKVTLPETDFGKYGYTFVGWTDGTADVYGNTKVFFKDGYTVNNTADEIGLSIVFEPKNNTEYTLTEYFDDEPKVSVLTGKTGATVDLSKRTALGYKRVSHEGEKLSGVITGFVKDAEGDVTGGERLELKIYYESVKYTISFDTTYISDADELKYKSEYTLPQAPQREGYTFEGYFINGVRYAPGDKVKMPASDIRVHVVWRSTATEETPVTGVPVGVAEEEELSPGAIAGITIGSVLGAAGLAVGGYFLYKYLNKKGVIYKLKNTITAKLKSVFGRKKDN